MRIDQLNILYHHRTQGKGVEGVHIGEMIRAWRKLGYKVDMVSPAGISVCDEVTDSHCNSKNLHENVYRFMSNCIPELAFELSEISYNYIAAKRLRKALSENKYSFLYERYALFNWSGAQEAKRAGIPLILEVNYTSYTTLYRKRSKFLKPLAHLINRKVLENADGIVVVSNYLKEHLKSVGISGEKIIVLTNAADPEVFNPDIYKDSSLKDYSFSGKTVIGFAGGFYPWHGLEILIEAFSIISRKHENSILLLVGDGPMRSSIDKKCYEMDLKERVILTGMVSHAQLPSYIAVFDIAVMPHSNEYGSPMKIYEYMSMGKPVIAPRFGPLEDGITHGVEGLLFEPKNIDELSECLGSLLQDISLRENMGRCGRERIVKRHNWQDNAEAVIKFYKSLQNKSC